MWSLSKQIYAFMGSFYIKKRRFYGTSRNNKNTTKLCYCEQQGKIQCDEDTISCAGPTYFRPNFTSGLVSTVYALPKKNSSTLPPKQSFPMYWLESRTLMYITPTTIIKPHALFQRFNPSKINNVCKWSFPAPSGIEGLGFMLRKRFLAGGG